MTLKPVVGRAVGTAPSLGLRGDGGQRLPRALSFTDRRDAIAPSAPNDVLTGAGPFRSITLFGKFPNASAFGTNACSDTLAVKVRY